MFNRCFLKPSFFLPLDLTFNFIMVSNTGLIISFTVFDYRNLRLDKNHLKWTTLAVLPSACSKISDFAAARLRNCSFAAQQLKDASNTLPENFLLLAS